MDPKTLPEGVYRRGRKLWIRYTVGGHEYREAVTTMSLPSGPPPAPLNE